MPGTASNSDYTAVKKCSNPPGAYFLVKGNRK